MEAECDGMNAMNRVSELMGSLPVDRIPCFVDPNFPSGQEGFGDSPDRKRPENPYSLC